MPWTVEKKCQVPGCERTAHALGYCWKHYQRLRSSGSLGEPERRPILAEMAETDWAYLAGLIDGEGCLGIYRRSLRHAGRRQLTPAPSYGPRLSIVNTNLDVMAWLSRKLGGGKWFGKKRISGHKPVYCWHTYWTDLIFEICRRCAPYLIIKRRQAILVLEFPAHVRCNQWTAETQQIGATKEALYQKTLDLNRRGGDHSLEVQ